MKSISSMAVLFKPLMVVLCCFVFTPALAATENKANIVVEHYANIAHATFEDALISARRLREVSEQFLMKPSAKGLEAARHSWRQARVPYLQSEVFRFGNPVVDDWEGQVNAWPLDEGLIDYVAQNYEHEMGNVAANANIIANADLVLGGESIDVSQITPQLLAELNELAGSEANVATGYHAIEFLLWGQDLNGTGPGAGNRPFTDYLIGQGCTHGHCDRRAQYLRAALDLLVSDLETMVMTWAPDQPQNYRAQLLALDTQEALTRMFYGMGSLALGELAGERMKVSLEAASTEDEQDCFSDNTHYAHFYDALGIQNVYLGQYERIDGQVLKGPSLSSLVAKKNPALNNQLIAALAKTQGSLQRLVDAAEDPKKPMKYDQMIAEGNAIGRKYITDSINSLVEETQLIEQAAAAIGITNLNPDTAAHQF